MFMEKTPDTVSKALGTLGPYTQDLEKVRPLKRPVLLWSTASLVYVHGDLHITSLGVWSTQVSGVTDEKLAWFFLLAVGYYLLRWLWGNWVALRSYWRQGILCHLWKASAAANFHIGFHQGQDMEETSVRCFDSPGKSDVVRVLTSDMRLKPDLEDIAQSHRTSRLTFWLSFYGVPFVFPLAVALWAILVLCARLS